MNASPISLPCHLDFFPCEGALDLSFDYYPKKMFVGQKWELRQVWGTTGKPVGGKLCFKQLAEWQNKISGKPRHSSLETGSRRRRQSGVLWITWKCIDTTTSSIHIVLSSGNPVFLSCIFLCGYFVRQDRQSALEFYWNYDVATSLNRTFFYLWVFFWLESKQFKLIPSSIWGHKPSGFRFQQEHTVIAFYGIFFLSKIMLGCVPADIHCGFYVSSRLSDVWGPKTPCGFLLCWFLTHTLSHSKSPFTVSPARMHQSAPNYQRH